MVLIRLLGSSVTLLLCCAAGASASTDLQPGTLAEALQQQDECAGNGHGGGEDGHCALAALQVRGARVVQPDQDHTVPEQEEKGGCDVVKICNVSSDGLKLAFMAPACVMACPAVCDAAAPLTAVAAGDRAAFEEVACAHALALSCALKPANAEACVSPLASLKDAWQEMPSSPAGMKTLCTLDENEEAPAPKAAPPAAPEGASKHLPGSKCSLPSPFAEIDATQSALVARAAPAPGLATERSAALDTTVQRKCCPPRTYYDANTCAITVSYIQQQNCHAPCRVQSKAKLCPEWLFWGGCGYGCYR